MRKSTFAILVFLFSCSNENLQDQYRENSLIEKVDSTIVQSSFLDTLNTTNENDWLNQKKQNPYREFSYGKELSPEKIGKLILEDSMIPIDNHATFKVLDAIEAIKNKESEFYFNVLAHIVKHSDGALSETMGNHIMKYIKQNPVYFFDRLEQIDSTTTEIFSFLIGYELAFSDDKGEKWFKEISQGCLNCSEIQTNQVKRITRRTKFYIKQNTE